MAGMEWSDDGRGCVIIGFMGVLRSLILLICFSFPGSPLCTEVETVFVFVPVTLEVAFVGESCSHSQFFHILRGEDSQQLNPFIYTPTYGCFGYFLL